MFCYFNNIQYFNKYMDQYKGTHLILYFSSFTSKMGRILVLYLLMLPSIVGV